MTSRWRPVTTTLICLAGLGFAIFLTYGHYFDQAAISTSCHLFEGGGSGGIVNCGLVTTSAESVIFGIPVAVYGLAYFVVMTAMCLPAAWRSRSMWLARGRLALNVAGIGFVVYLVSVELLELHHICLYCTCVHLLQFALFLVVVTGWYDTGYAQSIAEDYEASSERSYEEPAPLSRPSRSAQSAAANR